MTTDKHTDRHHVAGDPSRSNCAAWSVWHLAGGAKGAEGLKEGGREREKQLY